MTQIPIPAIPLPALPELTIYALSPWTKGGHSGTELAKYIATTQDGRLLWRKASQLPVGGLRRSGCSAKFQRECFEYCKEHGLLLDPGVRNRQPVTEAQIKVLTNHPDCAKLYDQDWRPDTALPEDYYA